MNLHFFLNEGKVEGMAMNSSTKVLVALVLLVPALFSIKPVFAQDKQLPKDARKMPLTRSTIICAVESRLRSARIYADKIGHPYLHIQVNVVGKSFSLSVELQKVMYDPISNSSSVVASWVRTGVGTHGQDEAYVMSHLHGIIDEFIVEYFRVNEKACERK